MNQSHFGDFTCFVFVWVSAWTLNHGSGDRFVPQFPLMVYWSEFTGLSEEFSNLRLQLARLARKTGNLQLAEKSLLAEVQTCAPQPLNTCVGDVMQALMSDVAAEKKDVTSVSVKHSLLTS